MSWSWLELLRIAVLPHNERSRAKLLLFKVDAFTKLRCWSISDLLLGNYFTTVRLSSLHYLSPAGLTLFMTTLSVCSNGRFFQRQHFLLGVISQVLNT